MREIDRALADIVTIRTQLARQQPFLGYGPATVASTGGLALAVAALQAMFLTASAPSTYLSVWSVTAVVALGLVGTEALTRSRRLHSRLADEMIVGAAELFAPVGAAGALIALVLARFEPGSVWMLPGLWQILVGIGFFGASRVLPRAIVIVAAFYFVAGVAVLILGSASHALSPWMMGVPFCVGQVLAALVLRRALGADDDA